MNTTDSENYKNYFENVKKIEIEQKCFNKSYKVENNFSLKKNKGKNIYFYLNIK